MDALEGYEAGARQAASVVAARYATDPDLTLLGELELWSLLSADLPKELTWIQWQAAIAAVREMLGFELFPAYPIAVAGEMANPAVRWTVERVIAGTRAGLPAAELLEWVLKGPYRCW